MTVLDTLNADYTTEQAAVIAAQQAIAAAVDSFLSTMSPLVATLNAANDAMQSAATAIAQSGGGQQTQRYGALPAGVAPYYGAVWSAYANVAGQGAVAGLVKAT